MKNNLSTIELFSDLNPEKTEQLVSSRGTDMIRMRRFFCFVWMAALVSVLPAMIACDGEETTTEGAGNNTGPAGTLRLKAEAHDRWVETWHTPEYGSHLHVKFTDDSRTEVHSYHGHGDSCIWTGTYVATQAHRYKLTGDPRARANVIRSAGALSRHLHVTGRPGFIARYVGPADDPGHAGMVAGCEADENCHLKESGPYQGDFWIGNTSRDQYTGWFMCMAFAYDLVNDPGMRNQIVADVALVLDRLIQDNWIIIDVDGEPSTKAPIVLPIMQMAWSLIGYNITGEERFLDVFAFWAKPHRQKQLRLSNIGIINRYAQHYGLNLAHENYLNLLRLSRPYPETHAFLQEIFKAQIHHWVDLQHNPWYTAVYLAEGDVQDPADFQARKEQIIQDLTDFPAAPKIRYAMQPPEAELDPLSVFLYDLQQDLPWLADIIGTVHLQAAEAYPVNYQCSSGFIFQRNMWAISCGETQTDPSYVNSGHDYLAAYWLASAYGILDKSD